jgi:Tfp pilus assembly protein PilO
MTLGSRERVVKIAGAVLGFLLAVIGWFFVIAPQRGQTAAVNDSVAGAQLGNAGLQARINQLDAQNKLLPRVEAELSRARLALPQDSGLPAFLQSLQRIGNATAAQVTSLSVGQPTSLAPSTAPSPTSSEASTAAPASSTAPEAGAGGA